MQSCTACFGRSGRAGANLRFEHALKSRASQRRHHIADVSAASVASGRLRWSLFLWGGHSGEAPVLLLALTPIPDMGRAVASLHARLSRRVLSFKLPPSRARPRKHAAAETPAAFERLPPVTP